MKKIYLLGFACISALSVNAQTITKTFNDPVFGDQFNRKEYDSVGVVPKSIGTSQLWDFSAFTQNANVLNTTFTTVATATNSASYVGATIVEMDGAGANTYYKSTATQYELVGAENTSVSYSYTNTAIAWAWPTGYGYTNSDTYSGSAHFGTTAGISSGSVTTNASGTGTLILPGGLSLTNVLQLTIVNSFTLDFSPLPFVLNIKAIDYDYFHASQKLPVLTVSYSSASGAGAPTSSAKIRVNNFVITGVNDFNFDATFAIFPNPAKDNFNIKLNNINNDLCKVEIVNSVGQAIKIIDLGNDMNILKTINLSDLGSGIYMVKTTLGDKQSVRKLIVE